MAQWNDCSIRLAEGVVSLGGKHKTFNATFRQDAHIFGSLYRTYLSYKYMFFFPVIKSFVEKMLNLS
jgi:hypothetical protein